MTRRQDGLERQFGAILLITSLLQVLGIAIVSVATLTSLLVFASRAAGEAPLDSNFVVLLMVGFLTGVTFGGVLLGLSALLRCAHAWMRASDGLATDRLEVDRPVTYSVDADSVHGHKPWARGAKTAAVTSTGDAPHVASVLGELRDLALLGPQDAPEVAERVVAATRRRVAELVVDTINLRQIGQARALLAEARASLGDNPTFEKLAVKIDDASSRNEPLDFARTRRLVEHAIAEGKWALAETYVHALWRDHPSSSRCRRLWDETRRSRLYAHVQQSADHHHWIEAVAAADEFLERFRDSFEADTLSGQMETLRANAEIQQRKQYERRFKELVVGKHYLEALRLAKLVIARYPQSPQAAALKDQVPALEHRLSHG